jgi:hypothetical protein
MKCSGSTWRFAIFAPACVCAFALAACASHRPIPPTDVPATLQVAKGQTLTAALHGTGVQIYECRASAQDPKRFAWVFQSPCGRSLRSLGQGRGPGITRVLPGKGMTAARSWAMS